MSEEEKEVLNFFENKEYSFTCEVPKKELYEALGIEETDFETEVIRINTLINLIKKQQKEIIQRNMLLDMYQNNYISKDKIRNLLKQVNASLYHFKDSEKNNIIQRIKDRLEQLLDDKN